MFTHLKIPFTKPDLLLSLFLVDLLLIRNWKEKLCLWWICLCSQTKSKKKVMQPGPSSYFDLIQTSLFVCVFPVEICLGLMSTKVTIFIMSFSYAITITLLVLLIKAWLLLLKCKRMHMLFFSSSFFWCCCESLFVLWMWFFFWFP